jgi:hypothetical protein
MQNAQSLEASQHTIENAGPGDRGRLCLGTVEYDVRIISRGLCIQVPGSAKESQRHEIAGSVN